MQRRSSSIACLRLMRMMMRMLFLFLFFVLRKQRVMAHIVMTTTTVQIITRRMIRKEVGRIAHWICGGRRGGGVVGGISLIRGTSEYGRHEENGSSVLFLLFFVPLRSVQKQWKKMTAGDLIFSYSTDSKVTILYFSHRHLPSIPS